MTRIHVVETLREAGPRELRFLYIGVREGLTYVQPFVEDRFGSGTVTARSHWQIPAATDPCALARERRADLVAVALPAGRVAILPTERAIILPFRIHLVVDLTPGPAGEHRGPSASERKRQRQRVKRYGYAYELSRRPEDFEWFYERLHLPTMQARHGERARSLPRELARRDLFEAGFLLFVNAGQQRVAGILCHLDEARGVCNARLVGWLDGDPVHLEREALKTGNHFLLDWARSADLNAVDFQGCEPFLSKGTYQSKRHLGAAATAAPPPLDGLHIWIHAARDVPEIRELLVSNPPILTDEQGGFRAVYFHDTERPARYDIAYRCGGIHAAQLVDLDAFLAGEAAPVREIGEPAPAASAV
jgi:hypothetical protein